MNFRPWPLVAALLLFPTAASSDEAPDIDPLAEEIVRDAAEFLAAQPTVSFQWFVDYDEIVEGREKINHLRSGSSILVRDVGFASRAEYDQTSRAYYYDGRIFTVAAPEDDFYASVPFSGGFEALVEDLKTRYDLVIPLWSMLSASLPDRLLGEVESGAYIGVERIAGSEAHHLAFSSYDEDWQVWISTDEEAPLPLMLVGTNPYTQGWPQYRAYLSDWDLAPDATAEQFTFTPDENDIRVSFPAVAEAAARGRSESGGD